MSGVTERLAERAVQARARPLPPEAITAAKRLVLDGLAIALAGTREEAPSAILVAHVAEKGAAPQATVIGFPLRTGVIEAALVNGASMHVLDYEPMWLPPNHAVSTTLPAVLALAEILPVTGIEFLAALIDGVEMQGLLRQASLAFEPRYLTFHPPGQVGPMGAAVAAGRLLGLDVLALRNAIGIAASRAGTLLANAGTMTKCLHCGGAVAAGLEAALLAKRGFTGNPDIIEVPNGYAGAFFRDGGDLAALDVWGDPWRVVEPGYAVKLFPSQFATHFAIRAALGARARIADPGLIRAVRLRTPVMGYIDRPAPATGLAGKFSFQYTAAAALLDGGVSMTSFEDKRRFAPDMERLLPLMQLAMDESVPAVFDRTYVEIEVDLASGETVKARCERLDGAWGNPVSDAEHWAKLKDCFALAVDDMTTARIAGEVERLETLDSAGLRALIRLLATPAPSSGHRV